MWFGLVCVVCVVWLGVCGVVWFGDVVLCGVCGLACVWCCMCGVDICGVCSVV